MGEYKVQNYLSLMGFLIIVFFERRFFIFQEKKLKIASHKLGFNGRGGGGGGGNKKQDLLITV